MSQARRLVEALEAAREHTRSAVAAAGQHRHRGTRGTLSQHITDLADLVEVTTSIDRITDDLAEVAKSCADNVRAHYVHGHTPSGSDWPQPLTDTAADADTALSKLRQHLAKITVHASHDALSALHERVRDVHRNPSTK
nr:hypothetical protein [Kibdelosporangium sp. MJ126-NF4]CEL23355.1 hypothetical protein [Kibdelosporangium sp. MJ126-NF4]CTQ96909.1 hypothetical protein [Kibdelosporangium sp. MJ126-NF4]